MHRSHCIQFHYMLISLPRPVILKLQYVTASVLLTISCVWILLRCRSQFRRPVVGHLHLRWTRRGYTLSNRALGCLLKIQISGTSQNFFFFGKNYTSLWSLRAGLLLGHCFPPCMKHWVWHIRCIKPPLQNDCILVLSLMQTAQTHGSDPGRGIKSTDWGGLRCAAVGS